MKIDTVGVVAVYVGVGPVEWHGDHPIMPAASERGADAVGEVLVLARVTPVIVDLDAIAALEVHLGSPGTEIEAITETDIESALRSRFTVRGRDTAEYVFRHDAGIRGQFHRRSRYRREARHRGNYY